MPYVLAMGNVAVLTGDLVSSTAAPPHRIEATMALLAKCAAEIGHHTRFTRFRGDGWQLSLAFPGDCLQASLYILAHLRANRLLGSRIAVGIGEEGPAVGEDLSAAMGPAFTTSGRALESMPKDRRLVLAGDGVDRFQELAFAFADDYANRWSVEQAEAMAIALSPAVPTQDTIAAALGISRQAVSARLKAAGRPLLVQACLAFWKVVPLEPLS